MVDAALVAGSSGGTTRSGGRDRGGAGPRCAGTTSSDVKRRLSRRSELGVQVAPPSTLVKRRLKNARKFSVLKLSANNTPAAGSTASPSTFGRAPNPLSRSVQVAAPSTLLHTRPLAA